jgi:hypothetical protein
MGGNVRARGSICAQLRVTTNPLGAESANADGWHLESKYGKMKRE